MRIQTKSGKEIEQLFGPNNLSIRDIKVCAR